MKDIIRTAKEEDLSIVIGLGKQYGHRMLYQKDRDIMRRFLENILICERDSVIVGFYHYQPIKEVVDLEVVKYYKQFPTKLLVELEGKRLTDRRIAVCMQGAGHREEFRELVRKIQSDFDEVWCWCSVKSNRPDSYIQLGFTFNEEEAFTFWNLHKGDYSTYRLGRWVRNV